MHDDKNGEGKVLAEYIEFQRKHSGGYAFTDEDIALLGSVLRAHDSTSSATKPPIDLNAMDLDVLKFLRGQVAAEIAFRESASTDGSTAK